MGIGEQIQVQREALGLSREALAGRADVSLSTIYRVELAQSIPRRATLTVIRNALAECEREIQEAAA